MTEDGKAHLEHSDSGRWALEHNENGAASRIGVKMGTVYLHDVNRPC